MEDRRSGDGREVKEATIAGGGNGSSSWQLVKRSTDDIAVYDVTSRVVRVAKTETLGYHVGRSLQRPCEISALHSCKTR